MKKALLFIDNEFEDLETLYPLVRMQEAGVCVEVVAPVCRTFTGKFGYPIEATRLPSQCNLDEVCAVVIPGGHAPDLLRMNREVVELVREAVRRGITVAAICHGPQLLIEAEVLRGRRATGYLSIRTDLVNAGARFEDSEAVVDGNIITSRTPADLPAFMRNIIGQIHEVIARAA